MVIKMLINLLWKKEKIIREVFVRYSTWYIRKIKFESLKNYFLIKVDTVMSKIYYGYFLFVEY